VLTCLATLSGLAVLYYLYRSKRESFKVLGSMGAHQRELYYKCTSACERSDPGKQLSPTHGNMMCQAYCDSVISDIARRGGPSYPMDYLAKDPELKSINDIAFHVCGDGVENRWCRDKLATGMEIDAKCRQDCEYSQYTIDECMNLCAKSKKGNYSRGWTWK
jgi:hypothetical protein